MLKSENETSGGEAITLLYCVAVICGIFYRYHNGTQGDYGTYLDLETNIDEQVEELEGFQDQ
jgi:hypothetical protein